VQLLGPPEEAHAGEQADESEIVVAVEMGDKDMVDLAAADLVFGHLHLGAFATIHQEYLVFHRHDLGCRVTIECG